MKKGIEQGVLYICTGIFVLSIFMIFIQNVNSNEITGFATQMSTVSNVSIVTYLSIDMSPNLTAGILFGSVNTLPATNVNATHNYDGNASATMTSMFMNVSTDSNTAVDFCIRSNDDLYDSVGGNRIGITNETYSNSTFNNNTLPALANQVKLNKTGYDKASYNISQGNISYFRFYLNVPTATPSGVYNNSITFKGVQVTTVC